MRHLPLVRSIVYRLRPHPPTCEVDDLVSAGTIGLIEAVDRFDSKNGVPFASFAYPRVKGAIVDEIRRLPQQRPARAADEVSLDAAVDSEANLALIDVIPDPLAPEPPVRAELSEVVDAIKQLPPREREALALHTAGHSVAEIAERHGCSESRASQILMQARCRLEQEIE